MIFNLKLLSFLCLPFVLIWLDHSSALELVPTLFLSAITRNCIFCTEIVSGTPSSFFSCLPRWHCSFPFLRIFGIPHTECVHNSWLPWAIFRHLEIVKGVAEKVLKNWMTTYRDGWSRTYAPESKKKKVPFETFSIKRQHIYNQPVAAWSVQRK